MDPERKEMGWLLAFDLESIKLKSYIVWAAEGFSKNKTGGSYSISSSFFDPRVRLRTRSFSSSES